MDPVVVALLPVLGTLAGAIVAGGVAVLVARENQKGQRDLERDRALREWRAARSRDLTQLVLQRAAAINRYPIAKRQHQQTEFQAADAKFFTDSHSCKHSNLVRRLPGIFEAFATSNRDTRCGP